MKPTRAEFKLSSGYTAIYADHLVPTDIESDGPFLLLPVTDYDEAGKAIENVDRSLSRKPARRKRAAKDSPPAPAVKPAPPPAGAGGGAAGEVPKPGSLPPKCLRPECSMSALPGQELCGVDMNAPESEVKKWREAAHVTSAQEGARRARGIRQQVEGSKNEDMAHG